MPERILVTCSRPRDALALLDEIIALRQARDRAELRAAWYLSVLHHCGLTPVPPPEPATP